MSKVVGITVGTSMNPARITERFIKTDETLSYKEGVLSVNIAQEPDPDNTLPITAAAVASTIGNIEILLKTI